MTWQAKANRLAKSTARRLGNTVTIGSVTAYGWLRSPEERVFDGVLVASDYTLELPVVSWPIVPENTVVLVDGAIYRAREESVPNADGSSIVVPLERLDSSEAVTIIYNGNFF
jgi:hypothetical protein